MPYSSRARQIDNAKVPNIDNIHNPRHATVQEPLSIYEEQVIHLLIHIEETFYSSSSRSSILILNGSASSFLFELLGYMADVKGNTVIIHNYTLWFMIYDSDDTEMHIWYTPYIVHQISSLLCSRSILLTKVTKSIEVEILTRCIEACEWN